MSFKRDCQIGNSVFLLGGKTMVKVNGQDTEAQEKTIAEYLKTANYDQKRIAVELNGEIVPKAQYANTLLKNGDCLEVVSFVGGG